MSNPAPIQSTLEAFEPVSLKETVSYGLGDVGFNLYWAPLTTFLMVYLTEVVGLKMASIATLLVVMRVISAIADPLFGAIADRTQTAYGKYRPWFLWLAIPLAAAGVLAFSTAGMPENLRLPMTYASLILLNLVYSAAGTAYNALSGVLTPDSDQREQVLSLRFGGAFLTAIAIIWLTPKLIAYAGPDQQALGWQFAMTLYGVAAIAIMLNLFLNTRERITIASQPAANPLTDISDLFRNTPWLVLFALGAVVMTGFMLHTAATPYFVKVCLGRSDLMTPFSMLFYLGLAGGAGLTSSLARRASRQLLISITLGVVGVASAAFYVCGSEQVMLAGGLQVVSAAAFGVVSTLTFAMYAEAADLNAIKTGRRATAMTYAMINFGKRLGAIAATLMMGWAMTGYVANVEATPEMSSHIRLMTAFVPAACAMAGAGIIWLHDLKWLAPSQRFAGPARKAIID